MTKQTDIEHIRHSWAHVLASAVKKLYPEAKLGIGPVIENGFYYDFALPAEALAKAGHFITDEDLPKIEKEMKKIASQDLPFKKEVWTSQKAITHYKKEKQPYKLELIKDLKSKKVGMVYTGDVFLDLCRGGHVKSTKEFALDALKLTTIAGAYWKGEEERPMLTRVYGVAFHTKKELDAHLGRIEEAEKRDHKKLGQTLGLFTFSDLVGAGLPLFLPKGTIIRNVLISFIENLQRRYGFSQVWIPHLAKPQLYKISGHWDKFKDDLFHVKGHNSEFVIKPMNCPHHIQLYKSEMRSYRDLPVRFFETTTVYRDEKTGELGGLTRVRAITQDDGHEFLREDQIEQEIEINLKIQQELVKAVHLDDYWIRLSLRDEKNKKAYLGNDAIWKKAQKQMESILKKKKIPYEAIKGEAAFYGPKMDFIAKDSIGREWQLSTIQLDFNQPNRFKLEYTAKDGSRKTPVMIHRAFMGAVERFMAMLIEHYAGAFPFWLAPEQIWIVPVSEKFNGYAHAIAKEFSDFRVVIKEENETLGRKIREGEIQKIPYLFIVGEKEQKTKAVAVRKRGKGDIGSLNTHTLSSQLVKEVKRHI